MARLFADENFPRPAVEHLRSRGHDVLTTQEHGWAGQAIPDDRVLEAATRLSRILLTLNRKDFIRLHRASDDHEGMIVCTYDPDFEALADRIDERLASMPALRRQLVRINRPG
jgi:predicted nuclease of predicted toxin-antitoxin system